MLKNVIQARVLLPIYFHIYIYEIYMKYYYAKSYAVAVFRSSSERKAQYTIFLNMPLQIYF